MSLFSLSIHSLSSPDRVLDVVSVEGDEEAEDCEEHDGVGCQHQAAGAPGDLKQRSLSVQVYRCTGVQVYTLKQRSLGEDTRVSQSIILTTMISNF